MTAVKIIVPCPVEVTVDIAAGTVTHVRVLEEECKFEADDLIGTDGEPSGDEFRAVAIAHFAQWPTWEVRGGFE